MKPLVATLLALATGLAAADGKEPWREAPDRTITWHPWRDEAEFRVRTGDRYLGHARWEHYLAFAERPSDEKEIKISMILLSNDTVPDVMLFPGRRYGIVEVTNSTMTAHKGHWRWIAEDVSSATSSHAYSL
jgi:hypothetical protein